jgi:hypothetical protein
MTMCEYSGKCANEIQFGYCLRCIHNPNDARKEDKYLPIKED